MLHRDAYQVELDKSSDLLEKITTSWLTDISNEILEMGAKIILLNLGYRGVYLRTSGINKLKQLGRAAPSNLSDWANQEVWSPCYEVDVIGTTGSGDATIAGFLSGILRGFSPLEAVDAAVAVGACNVEASDALSGLLSWEETMNRIARGWKKHSVKIPSLGWTKNANHQVWVSQI
jgi:sugar/nucleoside kinase (ribokinase family)